MRKIISTIALTILCIFPLYSQDLSVLNQATIEVAANIGKSVVSISSVVKEKIDSRLYLGSPFRDDLQEDFFRRFFEEFFGENPEREYKSMGLGSGIIIDKDGYILTNEHVVAGASEIKVKLSDGREFNAQVKGSDYRSDLAIIKVEAKDLPAIKLGDSDKLRIGEWVVAIGNPFGFAIENPEPTVTVGVVSALGRYVSALGRRERSYDDLIQTDAAINPGNSGGPLVNLNGEVIGINTAIFTTSGGYQGIGFAIPVNKAKKILAKLLKGEKILYGWLGVSIQDLNEDLRNYFGIKERQGVIVLKVYKDSPAESAGFKEGDLILSFNAQTIKTTRDLVKLVSSFTVGEPASLRILRSGKEMNLEVKIGKMPKDVEELETFEGIGNTDESKKVSFRGMSVGNLNSFYKEKLKLGSEEGVIIVDIEPDSLADKSGLAVGDIIFKIEGKKTKNTEEFKIITEKIKGNCLLKTNRGYFVLKDK
jgi:serine protease Do